MSDPRSSAGSGTAGEDLPTDGGGASRRWVPPAPDDPDRRGLPHHLRPAAAALFDGLPAPSREAAAEAAAGIQRLRASLSQQLPEGTELTVDAYRVRLAASCPASTADGDQPFSWTPATAARHLGLRALAVHLRGEGRRPVEGAVRSVLTEHVGSGGDRTPGPWLSSLDDSGRAVAEAQARRWAEQAAAWLPLRVVDPRCLRFLCEDWWPGGARRERTLVVHGRRDVTVDMAGSRVAATLASGGASDSRWVDVDSLTALAAALSDPKARVVRVVRVHPASGEVVSTDVTEALLKRGVGVVEATATTLASIAVGDDVPTAPGSGCTWCHRRHRCAPGTAWLDRPERRFMGLPVTAAAP